LQERDRDLQELADLLFGVGEPGSNSFVQLTIALPV
jgi:hypothetical protein